MTDEPQAGFSTLSDIEEAASRKTDKSAWAYIQGGAGEESTLRANREAFHRRTLRPRVLIDVENLEFGTTLLGTKVSAPFYVSPTASHGLVHPDAEAATARAASKANILASFSTLTSIPMEDIAKAAPEGPRWFQLYLQPEFAVTKSLVERAEKANYSAIILTVDMPVAGNRDRENQAGSPLASPTVLGNGREVVRPLRNPIVDGDRAHIRKEASNTWKVVDRLQEITRLPLVLKGILTREDARLAVVHGAKAVVVSNHGGRQLDGAQASLDALPELGRWNQARQRHYHSSRAGSQGGRAWTPSFLGACSRGRGGRLKVAILAEDGPCDSHGPYRSTNPIGHRQKPPQHSLVTLWASRRLVQSLEIDYGFYVVLGGVVGLRVVRGSRHFGEHRLENSRESLLYRFEILNSAEKVSFVRVY